MFQQDTLLSNQDVCCKLLHDLLPQLFGTTSCIDVVGTKNWYTTLCHEVCSNTCGLSNDYVVTYGFGT